MTPLLTHCMDLICLERDHGFDRTFESVSSLVRDYGEEGLAQRLVEEIPRTVPFEVVADLLNILLWSTSDNGHAVMETAQAWLRERTDTRRMLIALNLDCLPFSSERQARQVLALVSEKHPVTLRHCTRVLASWAEVTRKTGGT